MSTLGRILDNVNCEQDDKGVGQTKLTEGLKEQEKEADKWEKKDWEAESDKLASKDKLGHSSGELNVEEEVEIGGIGNLEGEVIEHCDKVMEEEEVEKSWVGDMEEDEICVSWTETW